MSRSQLIVLVALELWVGIVGGAVLYWTANDAEQLAVLPALITLVLLVPIATGVLIWLWVDDQNLRWGRSAVVLMGPYLLAGIIVVAPVIIDALQTCEPSPPKNPDSSEVAEETYYPAPCDWASVVSDTVAKLLTELGPFESLVMSPLFTSDDRPSARSLAGEGFWPDDRVWVENVQVNGGDFESSHWMNVSGRVRNWSIGRIRLAGIQVFFVTSDGDRVGDVLCSLGRYSSHSCGFSQTDLRSGYVADFEITLGHTGMGTIPSVANRDTAEVWVRFCPVS